MELKEFVKEVLADIIRVISWIPLLSSVSISFFYLLLSLTT